MGDLTEDFSRYEFACKCGCGFAAVDTVLLATLQKMRKHFRSPVRITSGCRCPAHNATTPGAAPNSYHTKGMAVDITVDGIQPGAVARYLDKQHPKLFGIGAYSGWVHFDVRPDHYARWDKT
jgi:uncharacterized protein YcbK (DUF882 family)